ncbi:hypothetical protein GSI_05753 [Ganoderma sinense ZZ0214-1]|uniref:Uncharacterized protein n=1 Tax=Ganoderma sinense ZZ0214-1 TaxID=1077348 RepID=A0A2G8SBB4_9APHY|nr:hypothetical protein GSI_05753 [Ganoderma sinense ZZ0214-1]
MPFGILGDVSELKRGPGKHFHIVLIPQPSDDSRGDPLNWPRLRKEACFWVLLVVSSAMRIAYLTGTHGANASHILALTEFALSLVSYGVTSFANGVVLSAGVRRTLLVVAVCQAACWATCVPMYVFGKRVRSFIARRPRLFR